jgi:outer membrane protein assembly factor BamB
MRPMRRILLSIILLISLASASHVWSFSTDGEVLMKPVIYRGNAVVASDDGTVYALNPMTGLMQWQTEVGLKPNEVFLFDNAVVASTTSGTVTKIGSNGEVLWTVDFTTELYNASYVYGASANEKKIYVSANNGIYEITKTGNATAIVLFNDSIATPPAAGSNYIIFGKEDELIKVNEKGQQLWTSKLDLGSFWLSRPVIQGGAVYIGALDNSLHSYALNNGVPVWEFKTRNWVLSTPLVEGGTVYVGSNDGYVYAVAVGSGQALWKAQTQLAVQTQPESGFMGGQQVIFVGGNDKNIYAISKDTGDVLWKGPSTGGVGSPLFYQNLVIAGSQDKTINAYSTERACSITSPFEGQLVGLKELVVSGNFVSQSDEPVVWMSINGQEWVETQLSEEMGWVFFMDPRQQLSAGLNTISCMVADAGGQETGPDFTSVTINHDPNAELSDFVIRKPASVIEGEMLVIYVNDGEDGSPVERFEWSLNGASGLSDKNITLTLGEGEYDLKVSKIGFNDAQDTIYVYSSGVNPIFLGGGILIILFILWQVWARVISKRFAKKKGR